MNIGNRIKSLRIAERLSQVQISKLVEISQPNISDWENDVTRPEYENLVKLAKIFHVSTDYLLGMEDELGRKIHEENFEYHDGTHHIKHSKK